MAQRTVDRGAARSEPPETDSGRGEAEPSSAEFAVGVCRAFGGALIFGLPILMTMEMWTLGESIGRFRLALLLLLNGPLLLFLATQVGFEKPATWSDVVRDAAVAYAVGALASAIVLLVFGVLTAHLTASGIVGMIAIQAVPASIGAMLARSQLGGEGAGAGDVPDERSDDEGAAAGGGGALDYGRELMLMVVGALFLGLNVAPTEEMILISYKMTEWHALALILLSVAIMHGFVYAIDFKGTEAATPGYPWWSDALRYTMPGYAIALLVSLYVLWTFGRMDGLGVGALLMSVVVLAFPAAIGAAAARLIL